MRHRSLLAAVLIVGSLFFAVAASAQLIHVAIGAARVAQAIGSIIKTQLVARGYLLADPRIQNTLTAVGRAAGRRATAAAVNAPAGSSVGWGHYAWGLGVTTATYVAADGTIQWLRDASGQVQVSGGTGTSAPTLNVGGPYWAISGEGSSIQASTALGAWSAYIGKYYTAWSPTNPQCTVNGSFANCSVNTCNPANPTNCGVTTGLAAYVSSGATCSSNTGMCISGTPYQPPTAPAAPVSVSQAAANLPAAEQELPLNPAVVADVINDAWQDAASQPGYDGIPFPLTNPVTASQVNAWRQANTAGYPAVKDAFLPIAPGAVAGSQVGAIPVAAGPDVPAVPLPATPGAPAAQVNLGSDPAIPLPVLEPTPTAEMILAPILSMFGGLRGIAVPLGSPSCPLVQVPFFDETLTTDTHCQVVEQHRTTFSAIFVLLWSIVALRIVLRA